MRWDSLRVGFTEGGIHSGVGLKSSFVGLPPGPDFVGPIGPRLGLVIEIVLIEKAEDLIALVGVPAIDDDCEVTVMTCVLDRGHDLPLAPAAKRWPKIQGDVAQALPSCCSRFRVIAARTVAASASGSVPLPAVR